MVVSSAAMTDCLRTKLENQMNNPASKAAAGRHPSTVAIAQYFDFAHLPIELANVSAVCSDLAAFMIDELPDGPELAAGLRKLLEAKDCFVRQASGL